MYYIIDPKNKITIYGFMSNPNKKNNKVKSFSYLENAVVELTSEAIQTMLEYHNMELTQRPYADKDFKPIEQIFKK